MRSEFSYLGDPPLARLCDLYLTAYPGWTDTGGWPIVFVFAVLGLGTVGSFFAGVFTDRPGVAVAGFFGFLVVVIGAIWVSCRMCKTHRVMPEIERLQAEWVPAQGGALSSPPPAMLPPPGSYVQGNAGYQTPPPGYPIRHQAAAGYPVQPGWTPAVAGQTPASYTDGGR